MSKLSRSPEIIWRVEIEDKLILDDADLYDAGTVILAEDDMLHELNFVGGKVWVLADGERTVSEIVDEIHQLVDVDRETLATDVAGFIDEMVENGWMMLEEAVN